ncbi:MAG: hypothetical protein P8X74_12555 [Reinekea sp.]
MFRYGCVWLSVALLFGCQTENSTTPIEEDSGDLNTNQTGDGSLNLTVNSVSFNADTAGPVFTTLNLTVEEGTQLTIFLDDVQIVQENIQCLELPAGTFCNSSKAFSTSFIVEQAGTHDFDVQLTKNSQSTVQEFNYEIKQGPCQSSEQIYTSDMKPFLKSNCEGCHGNGNAGTFDADYTWSQMTSVLNSEGDQFYKVPSGEAGNHDGGVRFQPNGGTYRLFAEMLWRAENNFVCTP